MQKKSDSKFRYWAVVCYPESLPENWRQLLTATGLPVAISPLHDLDINESADAEEHFKKSHYHLILCWASPTTQRAADTVAVDLLHGVHAQGIRSIKGAYRYLCHLDNPEKHQYSVNDITALNGFNIDDYVQASDSEVNSLYIAVENIIHEQHFEDLFPLMIFLQANNPELARFVRFHTYYIEKLLNSIYKLNRKAKTDELRDLQLTIAHAQVDHLPYSD